MANQHNMETLFQDLEGLVKNAGDWSFTSKDLTLEGRTYRIYDYHLTSWTSFQAPNALNCRGTMFDITDIEHPVLASLPPPKFFNFDEGGVDHATDKYVADVMVKLDGSLISTYVHNNTLRLKTKGHMFSEQALAAMDLFSGPAYKELHSDVERLAKQGYTVSFEYTAPTNRIVVLYPKAALTVLNIRRHSDGAMFFGSDIQKDFKDYPAIVKNLVEFKTFEQTMELTGELIHKFVEDIKNETVGEGVVAQFKSKDGQHNYLAKIKNNAYVSLHHAKSSIESPTKLLEAIIRGQIDDLRSLLMGHDDALKMVDSMQLQVAPVFNQMIATVSTFYEANKELSKKDYAIKGQKELGIFFGLGIALYLQREPEYVEFAIKNKKTMFAFVDFSVEKVSAPNEIETAQEKRKMKM